MSDGGNHNNGAMDKDPRHHIIRYEGTDLCIRRIINNRYTNAAMHKKRIFLSYWMRLYLHIATCAPKRSSYSI